MTNALQHTISPYTQGVVYTRQLCSINDIDAALDKASAAQQAWRRTSLEARQDVVRRWTEEMASRGDEIGRDLALQMGRPIRSGGELRGVIARTEHLVDIAPQCLESIQLPEADGRVRKSIMKQPLGVIVIISPWNYPLTCIINSLIPALLAGNSVILKPAPQAPKSAETICAAFTAAGLPEGVLQVLHADRQETLAMVADKRVAHVVFTGSVEGGRAIARAVAAGESFASVGLELGGKDPAYVRADADVEAAAVSLVDGCSVERIYVHETIHDHFVAALIAKAKELKLGDPLDCETTLGPVISLHSAARIRKQVEDAVKQGAKLVLGERDFAGAETGTTRLGPMVLTNVTHSMDVMTEETFGPVVGIMPVDSDDQALALMNDSQYGLTASVWTNESDPRSTQVFDHFCEELEAGTVYLNAADCMSAALPWTGVKNSGRGVSLSTFGFDQVTRLKGIRRGY